MNKITQLKKLREKINKCQKCSLYKEANKKVFLSGTLSKILIIGEAPGEQEDKKGTPFVGKSGKKLRNNLDFLKDFAITNIVKCRPPNNETPSDYQVMKCKNFLQETIDILDPEIIITLGNPSTNFFLLRSKITKVCNQGHEVKGRLIYPMLHPAASMRRKEWKKKWDEGWKKFRKYIEKEKPSLCKNIKQKYVPLHCHTQFSVGDAYGTPEYFAKTLKEKGFDACSITDHGSLCGNYTMQKALEKEGIKPIHGCEMYITDDINSKNREHITLLAKNEEGWKNLIKLNNFAQDEGFYYKPQITYNRLWKNNSGLIAMSACMNGILSSPIRQGNKENARKLIQKFKKKDIPLYAEIMFHDIEESHEINKELVPLAKEEDIPLIFTLDSHYPKKTDKEIHNTIKAITFNDDYEDAGYEGNTYYFMTTEEVKEKRPSYISKEDLEEMFNNTQKIAKECNFRIESLKKSYLPQMSSNSDKELEKRAFEGIKKREMLETQDVKDRLKRELDRISDKDFSNYFLVVKDYIDWCKENKILTGVGRGSAAGSLVCYALGITGVNPLKHDLLFERFLSEAREDMPDIDIDFEDEKRHKVRKYLKEKYGKHNVAKISTFTTYHFRLALRDVGRVFGIGDNEIDALSSLHDSDKPNKIYKMDMWKKFKKRHSLAASMVPRLEGSIRHRGIHAGGLIISNTSLNNLIPTVQRGGTIATAWDMEEMEEIGLVKFDLLGLRSLSIIGETLKLTGKNNLPQDMSDSKVLNTIENDGIGIFQFENKNMQSYISKVGIDNFEEVYNTTALHRPGAMVSGQAEEYEKRKKMGSWTVSPSIKNITRDTYGLFIFQEQIMQMLHNVGNFTWSETEKARKYIGKKKEDKIKETKKKFFDRCKLPKKEKIKLFGIYEAFGKYGFNKSHAVAYSKISYYMAYLKTYCPKQFFLSLIKLASNKNKKRKYIRDAQKHGINIVPPDINKCENDYIIKGNTIYVGFSNIKWMGERNFNKIKRERPFKTIEEYAATKPGKRTWKVLTKAGALDCFKKSRAWLIENRENLIQGLETTEVPEWEEREKILYQSEVLDTPLNKDVVKKLPSYAKNIKLSSIEEIENMTPQKAEWGLWLKGIALDTDEKEVKIKGDWFGTKTPKKSETGIITLDDGTGSIECRIQPFLYNTIKDKIRENKVFSFLIQGHIFSLSKYFFVDDIIFLDSPNHEKKVMRHLKEDKEEEKIEEAQKKFPDCRVGVIQSVSYKVSKKGNSYVRMRLFQSTNGHSFLYFKPHKKLFEVGEIIAFTVTKHPFIKIYQRF